MSSDLREQLADLARDAPSPVPAPDLWRRGRRRAWRQRLATATTLAVALACLGSLVGLGALTRQAPEPTAPSRSARLPDRFFTPSPWLGGTSGHPIGPLIAILDASRSSWHDVTQSSRSSFVAVSATTGEYRFLDLPDAAYDDDLPAGQALSLSPDGRHIGYWLGGQVKDAQGVYHSDDVGFAVYDTTTGTITRFEDAKTVSLVPTGIAWTRGTAWFQYRIRQGASSAGTTTLVDLSDGSRRTTADAPTLAQVFGDGRRFTAIGERGLTLVEGPEGRSRMLTSNRALASAYPSPDGTRIAGFPRAGVCCPERSVLVGAAGGAGPVTMSAVPGTGGIAVLGWRDDRHVVVQRTNGVIESVDVATGAALPLTRLSDTVVNGNGASFATGLLDSPVVPGQEPPDARNPVVIALLWVVGVGALAVVGLVGLVWVRRRRGRA